MAIDGDALLKRLDVVAANIDKLREDMEAQAKKRDTRIRTNQFLTVCAILAATVGIWVGVNGAAAQREANADRDAGRRSSCLQYNRQIAQEVAAQVDQSHAFVAAIIGTSPDPAIISRATRFNQQQDARIASGHKLRDCTAAGIRQYLAPATTSTVKGKP